MLVSLEHMQCCHTEGDSFPEQQIVTGDETCCHRFAPMGKQQAYNGNAVLHHDQRN
jgi:hypothetical protein